MIKAILFDMDGVLIDAKDWHYEALNMALDNFGMAIDRDAHLATYDGLPTRTKLEMLSKSRGLPTKLHKFINELKQIHTVELTYAKCRPVFHHQKALRLLKEDGYKLAVCSNSIYNTIDLMMRQSRLGDYMDLLLSNEDVTKPKPDPEIYLTAMQRFGVQPHEALILEDNDHGIQAARASGAHVMVVGTTNDVNYERIRQALDEANQANAG